MTLSSYKINPRKKNYVSYPFLNGLLKNNGLFKNKICKLCCGKCKLDGVAVWVHRGKIRNI